MNKILLIVAFCLLASACARQRCVHMHSPNGAAILTYCGPDVKCRKVGLPDMGAKATGEICELQGTDE